jgi:hypothetical protein
MKQAARIKFLSLLFVITGLGAAFVLLKNTGFGSNDSTLQKISLDSASINKVTLKYDQQTTVLTKGQRSWMVNNKFKARPNPIQLMVVGLSKVEIKRPVAEENKKKVIALLKQKGISVKAEGGERSKSFLIMANENDANSSYYMQDGSTDAYVVYVPGFTGDMSNIFKMTEADWRSRELFISTPLSLQKVSVSYPAFKERNVEIKWNADKTFTVAGVKNIDSTKVITYLSQFEQVNVDNYIYKDKEAIMAFLKKNAPQAIIEVSDLDLAGNHKLSLYNESKDPVGIYAIVEPENELVTMKQETLFRILVRKEFFEKKK